MTGLCRAMTCAIATFLAVSCRAPAPSAAAEDVLARVRARGVVRCAGIVRPGIAVPTVDGARWYGMAPDVCRAIAAAVLGDASRMTFRPYFQSGARGSLDAPDDVVFLSGAELVGEGSASTAGLALGPAIVHDALALLVPAAGVAHAADLGTKTVCVEPGSDADRALTRYFEQHAIALHEHPFQETDEMRQAYGDGKCDALAGPLTTLANVRSDPAEGHRGDRILAELLADDPIFAATAGDARWSRIVWWIFSALVAAEDNGADARAQDAAPAIAGVPPAVGKELGLPAAWVANALTAAGDYGTLFDRNLGTHSRFGLARGTNASWRNGGLIFGLHVE